LNTKPFDGRKTAKRSKNYVADMQK